MNGEIEIPYFASAIYRSFVIPIIKCAMPLTVKLPPGVMFASKTFYNIDKPRPCYRLVPEWVHIMEAASLPADC